MVPKEVVMKRGVWFLFVVALLFVERGPARCLRRQVPRRRSRTAILEGLCGHLPRAAAALHAAKGELADMNGLDKALSRAGHQVMIARDLPTFTKALQERAVESCSSTTRTSRGGRHRQGNRRQALGAAGLEVDGEFPEDARRDHEDSFVAQAVLGRRRRTRMRPALSFAAAIVLLSAAPACAQAWLASQGEITMSFVFSNSFVDEHDLNGLRDKNSDIDTNSLLADVTFGVRDNLSVTVALPIVSSQVHHHRHPAASRRSRTTAIITPRRPTCASTSATTCSTAATW